MAGLKVVLVLNQAADREGIGITKQPPVFGRLRGIGNALYAMCVVDSLEFQA